MSRPVSEFTEGVRKLLAQYKGDITHADARPLLEKMRIAVAEKPGDKTEEYSKFEACWENGRPDLSDEAVVEKALHKCGFEGKIAKAVLDEATIRSTFAAEANSFNVTKNGWMKKGTPKAKTQAKSKGKSGRPVGRPVVKKVGSPAVAKKAGRPKATVAVFGSPTEEAFGMVKKAGGLASAEAKVAALREEADALEKAVAEVHRMEKMVKDAA